MAGINYRTPPERPPTDYYEWMDDFLGYDASNWVITETGTGTRAVNDDGGGILVVTNDANDNDANFFQWDGEDNGSVAEIFSLASGRSFYFGARLKVSDATQSDFVFGLQVTDTTPLAVSDGVWFGKDDGDASLDFHIAASSTQTDATALYTVVDNTYMVLEAVYHGDSQGVGVYVDGVKVGSVAITNIPTTEISISFGIQNGAGAAKVMSVDWIRAVVER